MLQTIDNYIFPEHRQSYASLLLVNLLLRKEVKKEAINPRFDSVLNLQDLSLGVLACYQRQDYEITVYLLMRLFPSIKC